jgi:hypothetical protein
VLDKWYVDARNSKGEVLYPGAIPKGSELFWPAWLTGDEKGSPALVPLFGRDFVRYMAFPGSTNGYRPAAVAKILGGNARRMFQRVGETGSGTNLWSRSIRSLLNDFA